MMIKASIENKGVSNKYISGRVYYAKNKISQLININRYNKIKDNDELEVKIQEIMFNDLEKEETDELKLIADYYNIENYWSMKRETLIEEINKILNKEDNEDSIIEGDN